MSTETKQPQATNQGASLVIDGKPASQREIERLLRIKPQQDTARGNLPVKSFSLMRKAG